jgi:hypothetical protein
VVFVRKKNMLVCHNPCLEDFYLILGTVQENEPVPDSGSQGQTRGGTDAGAGPVRTGPDASADPVLYPALPDAIAPSLATTPEFARRGTIWCHASGVILITI